MLFKGIGRTFSTENDQQYETIGAFWDELAAVVAGSTMVQWRHDAKIEIRMRIIISVKQLQICVITGLLFI